MKLPRSILLFIGLAWCVAAIGGPPTSPSVSYSEDRYVVLLQTFTDDDVRYECKYSVAAVHDDGTPDPRSGTTDPPTGGQPTTAATLTYGAPVKTANVTLWDCVPLSLPNRAKSRPTPIYGIPCDGDACRDIQWSHDNKAIYATNAGSRTVHIRFGQADCVLEPTIGCGIFGNAIVGTPQADYVSQRGPRVSSAQHSDNFECGPPYGPRVPPVSLRKPFALNRDVRPGQKADLCVAESRSEVLLGTDCHRREVIHDQSPKWDCPLNKPCFGSSSFDNGRREPLPNGQDNFCVTFTNRATVPQDVGVNFHF
jgi:hypothetical protein